jgi:hypothetical protein
VLTTIDNTMGAKDEDWAYFLEAFDDDILEGMDAFEATKLLHTPWKINFTLHKIQKIKVFLGILEAIKY